MAELVFDYLIIGGGIAGTTAAETIRQKDQNGSVALICGEPHFLYSRVLLPEFIRKEIELDKVMLRTAGDYKKNGIDIFLNESVCDFNSQTMTLKTISGKEFRAKKILIASGGRPKLWNFETLLPGNIFRLQTLDDALKIKEFLSSRPSGTALVVGGGFMALEFIAILAKYGWKIKLLCAEKYFWPDFLDETGFGILKDLWQKNGIETIFGREIKNSAELDADFVGVGIGLDRNLDFLPHAAIKPPSGGLEVNEHLETGTPNVWAAGDVASYKDRFSGRRRSGGNWSGAFMQGRTAGLNMAGGKESFKNIPVYAISHLGVNISFVGDVGPFAKGDAFISKGVTFASGGKNGYIKIFMKDNRVIGAVLMNGQRFLGKINQAIMNGWADSKITLD